MEGSAIAPPHQVAQKRFMFAALILGAAGSLVAVGAWGKGTYTVGQLVVKMEIRPSTEGTTEIAVEPVRGLSSGFLKRETHTSLLAFRATVVSFLGTEPTTALLGATADPGTLADTIQKQGKDAARRFGLKIGWLTLAGGGAGGLVIALMGMKARRVLQGAAAGLVVMAALGLLAWQTYDADAFQRTQFQQAGQSAPFLGP